MTTKPDNLGDIADRLRSAIWSVLDNHESVVVYPRRDTGVVVVYLPPAAAAKLAEALAGECDR